MLEINGLSSVYLGRSDSQRSPYLMVVLHGLGDSVEGYRFLPQFLGVENCDYLLLNAPDDYYTGYSWFDIYNDPAPGVVRSRKLLFSVVDQLKEQGYTAAELILFGFSQGSLMVTDLTCRYPERFAGTLGISGYVYGLEEYPEAFSLVAKEQKILATHGTFDPVLPIQNSRTQVQALQNLGMDIRWREYEKEHTIDPVQEKQDIVNFILEITNSR